MMTAESRQVVSSQPPQRLAWARQYCFGSGNRPRREQGQIVMNAPPVGPHLGSAAGNRAVLGQICIGHSCDSRSAPDPPSNHKEPMGCVAPELFDKSIFPIEIGLHRARSDVGALV